MKLEVHGDGYLAAADAFATANHRAAVCHDRLVGRLAGFAGMAGDDSSSQEFAASYDEAAREAVAALADLADACAGLGRLTHASLANHRHAEARSVVGGSAVSDDGPPAGAGYVVVLPATPPGSLGANPSSLPGPVSWILDHLEGVVWPGADVARLRSAAETWHAAAAGLTDLEECFDSALRGLWAERSPEIPRAIEATHELRGAARGLGERYAALAVASEAYADHVEAKRAEMLHLAEWLLEQVVEGILISAAIGALTAGAGTAAGLSAVAARVAAESPRFLRILEALRALAASTASGVRVTREGLRTTRLTLTKFREATVARSAARGEGGQLRMLWTRDRGWLATHEHSGSHADLTHTGRSVRELRQRLLDKPKLGSASSFADRDSAERWIAQQLHRDSEKIEAWLPGDKPKLRLDGVMDDFTGTTVHRSGDVVQVKGIRVVLVRDASMPDGFRILTAFPQP